MLRRWILGCLLAGLAAGQVSGAAAQATLACWLETLEQPTTGDELPVTNPSAARMRETVRRIDGIARANRVLQRMSNTRLRNTRFVGAGRPGTAPRTGGVTVVAYPPEVWAPEGCGLVPQADRLRGAEMHLTVNELQEALRSPMLSDEGLTAFQEPRVTGRIGMLPVYSRPTGGGNFEVGELVILTAGDRAPWVPVTLAEHLAFQEREMLRRRESAGDEGEPMTLDEKAVSEMYATLLKTNRAAAEEYRKSMEVMRATMKTAGADAQQRIADVMASIEDELRALRAFREARSGGELAAQARWGGGPFGQPQDGQASAALVKADANFAWDRRDQNRVQMITVRLAAPRREYLPELTQALHALDFAALRALIR
jgi:hypothetical protein